MNDELENINNPDPEEVTDENVEQNDEAVEVAVDDVTVDDETSETVQFSGEPVAQLPATKTRFFYGQVFISTENNFR